MSSSNLVWRNLTQNSIVNSHNKTLNICFYFIQRVDICSVNYIHKEAWQIKTTCRQIKGKCRQQICSEELFFWKSLIEAVKCNISYLSLNVVDRINAYAHHVNWVWNFLKILRYFSVLTAVLRNIGSIICLLIIQHTTHQFFHHKIVSHAACIGFLTPITVFANQYALKK